jgi:hypothetical protein
MRILLLLPLLVIPSLNSRPASNCTVEMKVVDGPSPVRVQTLTCDGTPAVENRIEFIDAVRVDGENCSFRVLQTTRPLVECVIGVDENCVPRVRREYSAFRFGQECGIAGLSMPFELSGDVGVDDVHGFVRDFDLARELARNPHGLGWTAPMKVLAISRLSDIQVLSRKDGRWDVEFFVCDKICARIAVSFPARPKRLEDVNAHWID